MIEFCTCVTCGAPTQAIGKPCAFCGYRVMPTKKKRKRKRVECVTIYGTGGRVLGHTKPRKVQE